MSNNNSNNSNNQGPTRNRNIRARSVLVIDENGTKLGEMATRDALVMAQERGLDLIEVAANANPPVCRFADYGKLMYEKKKRNAKARRNATTISVKEVKFTPSTGEHDFNVKVRNAKRFLNKGDKVKVTIRFRGREMAHRDKGQELCDRILAELNSDDTLCEVEVAPAMVGRQMTMILNPKK